MPTLTDYYTMLASELGEDFVSAAAAGSSAATLVDTAWPIKSSLDMDNTHVGETLWRPTAALPEDRVRFVKTNTSSNGDLVPDHVWTNPPIAGEVYHLLTGLPPVDGSTIDMRSLINEGLKHCYATVEVYGTPTVRKTRHFIDLITPWLVSERQVLRVGVLADGDDRDEIDPYRRVVRGTCVRDGDALYLDHAPRAFAETDTLIVEALKPGYDHCRAAGDEFGSQAGLLLETDECPVPVDWAVSAALVIGWRRLRLRFARNPDLLRDRGEALAWFNDRRALYLDTKPRTFLPGPLPFGGSPAWGR